MAAHNAFQTATWTCSRTAWWGCDASTTVAPVSGCGVVANVRKAGGGSHYTSIMAGLNSLDTYLAFAQRVRENADSLVAMLRALKADGKRVFALGAPVKGSTLLNFCGIGPDLIECATEINVRKIGRLIPGTRIPIVDETALTSQPDYYLVLTWNFLEFLRQRYDGFLRAGGRFIAPVPEVSIVGPAERLPGANGQNSP